MHLQITQEIKQLNDDIPAQLAAKIEKYNQLQTLAGKLEAAAQLDYGKAEAERKRAFATTILSTDGTQVVKEASAEIACTSFRVKESEALSELIEWKNLFKSYGEIVQTKKLQLRLLMKEWEG